MIVEKIIGNMKEFEAAGRAFDRVLMQHDEMMKAHQRVVTENGKSFGLSLAEGEHLHDGDVLYEDENSYVIVELREEKVFELRPKTGYEWARAAYNIGNMHQKAYLYEDCIRVPYDYVLEKTMAATGVAWSVETRRLDGIPAAVSAREHQHSHDHVHSHHHAHDIKSEGGQTGNEGGK